MQNKHHKYNVVKRNLFFIFILIGCCACSNDARLLSGDYSYKTSGTLTISRSDTTEIPYDLNRIGQLSVIDLKSSDNDSVLLVFNELTGGVTTVRAKVDGDSLQIVPYTKNISVVIGLQSADCEIEVNGRGVRYDDIIMLDETYNGEAKTDTITIKIHGNHISTVANRN